MSLIRSSTVSSYFIGFRVLHDNFEFQAFHSSTGYFPRGIRDMAAQLNLRFEGRLHSGIGKFFTIIHLSAVLLKSVLI